MLQLMQCQHSPLSKPANQQALELCEAACHAWSPLELVVSWALQQTDDMLVTWYVWSSTAHASSTRNVLDPFTLSFSFV